MIKLRVILIAALAASAANSQSSSGPRQEVAVPASCPVTTRPAKEFVPPADYHFEKMPDECFWIGSEKLWTDVCAPMLWYWRPHGPGHEIDLTAKVFWYRMGYSWHREPVPKLRVTGRRLDGPAPDLETPQHPATHAIIDSEKGAMLTGVWVPTPGCWEITGNYEGDKLGFVVWVEPPKPTGQ